MLKENWRLLSRLEKIGDIVIIIASFLVAYYGRNSFIYWNERFDWGLTFQGNKLAPLKDYVLVLLVAVIAYVASLHSLGAYNSMRLSSAWQQLRTALLSSFVVFLSLSALIFLSKLDVSRALIILFCCIGALGLAAERYLTLALLRFWRRRGSNFRNILIAGTGPQAARIAAAIFTKPELGIRIRGYADFRSREQVSAEDIQKFRRTLREAGVTRMARILRGPSSIAHALSNYAIDEVIFTDCAEHLAEVRQVLDVCSMQGVRTTIAADVFSLGMVQSHMSHFAGMPLIHFQTPPGDRWELNVKRFIDVILSGLLLILLSPVFIVVAILVKGSSPGPVFFAQRRMGLSGRIFTMYKFRSMVFDAEERKEALKSYNLMQGPVFKMAQDPRITKVGAWLRKYSLDELPQLWNVLKGDMSLVGPRPPVPGEVSLYERKDRRRLSMRPGLTCIWQVSGRNTINKFEDWVEMDLAYIDNWSLAKDFELLIKTVPAVFSGKGAN